VPEEPEDIRPPSAKPVVGFHSYGNQYRWPANESVFKKAYVSAEYEARIFGHLTPARNKYSEALLERVNLIHFSEMEEQDFLRTLDFWVYFPHHRLQDRVWAPVLKAMHAGKVVILPRRLERIYGDAAVYADTVDDVNYIISRLSRSSRAYVEQAKRGQRFIGEFFSPDSLNWRVARLLSYRNVKCGSTKPQSAYRSLETYQPGGVCGMSGESTQVRIARIGRPHGIRGEVTVEVFTESPETRFVKGAVFMVQPEHNDEVAFRQLTLEQARRNKSILLLKFVEFSDR